MTGYKPGTDKHWDKSWKIIGSRFGGTLAPMKSPSFEVLSNVSNEGGCPGDYDGGVKYGEGDTVSVNKLVFRCEAWPYSGHCSQQGYKPMTNTATPDAWKEAWDFIGDCERFYYTLDVVDAAVAQSQLLYQVAEVELVWEHGIDAPY